jgi:hypothetical protein
VTGLSDCCSFEIVRNITVIKLKKNAAPTLGSIGAPAIALERGTHIPCDADRNRAPGTRRNRSIQLSPSHEKLNSGIGASLSQRIQIEEQTFAWHLGRSAKN